LYTLSINFFFFFFFFAKNLKFCVLPLMTTTSHNSVFVETPISKLGVSLFCEDCGTFVVPPQPGEDETKCRLCGNVIPLNAFLGTGSQQKVTMRRPDPWDHLKNSTTPTNGATIDTECPKCGYHRMSFKTAQLRSVDEGQTVFYTCCRPGCEYTFALNN
jgi:DNA-directed RNA polymerase I subunit RPA12